MNAHHIVFSPKYRRGCLCDVDVAAAVERHIRHICNYHEVDVLALSINYDHLHLFIDFPRKLSVSYIVQQIKWFSSIHTRKQFPNLVSKVAFWQRNFFSRSIGGDYAHVKKYIENQGISLD